MKTLLDLFLNELADMYDAEMRLVKALPKMAKAATCPDLQAAIHSHLEETNGHVTKLEQVFEAFDKAAKAHTCEATMGLLEEGDKVASEFKGSPAINAAIISVAQKVEHYEIASYGCLHEWAGLLENEQAADLLAEILSEEKAANESLTKLATGGNNEEALGEGSPQSQKESGKTPVIKQRGMQPANPLSKRGSAT